MYYSAPQKLDSRNKYNHLTARPMPLSCSQSESKTRYDFLGIFTSHKSKG